jgi:hypothetical protein
MTHSDFARYMPLLLDHIKESLPEVPEEAGAAHVPAGDFLPQWLLDEHKLMPWLEALSVVHAGLGSGHSEVARKEARRRMAFNECLLLSLMMLHHRVRILLSDRTEQPPVICNSQVAVRSWLCCFLLCILFIQHIFYSIGPIVALLECIRQRFCGITEVNVCCVFSSF